MVISDAVVPSTRGWPLPMKTLIVPAPSAIVVTFTLLASWSISAIALIEQVVGRLAGIFGGNRDLTVEARNALRQQRHFARFAGKSRIDVGRHVTQAFVVILQPLGERPALRQQHLARGNGSRRAR